MLLCLSICGCKSLPKGSPVNPVDLLDNNSAFYISIPAATEPELINKIITSNISEISTADANNIIQRINTLYCGLNKTRTNTDYQIAIDADIPVKYLPKILNQKNGWQTQTFKPTDSNSEYKIFYNQDVEMAFPSSNVGVLGRDIDLMLAKYEAIHSIPADSEFLIEPTYTELDLDLYNWITSNENDIRFYANKPQSFLTILTGASLDLKLFYVKGKFSTDLNNEDQFILDLDFFFKNEKYRKAGKTLLSLAFGLTDSQSIIIGTNELQIYGIKLRKEQLYQLMVL